MRKKASVLHPHARPAQPAPKPSADAELFRSAVGCVTAIKSQNKVTLKIAKPACIAIESKPDRFNIALNPLSDSLDEPSAQEFLSNGLSRLTLRKLRRGQFPVQSRLDLHGYTCDEARQILYDFIHATSLSGLRCVLIIHGKGLNSQNGEAVLKSHTRHWLRQLSQVLAFCNAPPHEGGSGAVRVLLRVTL